MRIVVGFLFLISIIIIGCTSGISIRAVNLTSFFCDNSSKVWMVNNLNLKNPDATLPKIDFRDVFIFYKSGSVKIQPLNSLGNQEYEKANYYIDSDLKTLQIDFAESNTTWLFRIEKVHTSKVILSPISPSQFKESIELIPLPEF